MGRTAVNDEENTVLGAGHQPRKKLDENIGVDATFFLDHEPHRRDETHAVPRPGTQDNRCLSLLAQKPLYHALERDEALMQHNGSSGNTRGSNARREKADIYFGDAAHMRSDHHAGRTWGKKGETPVVLSSGARYSMSLISAVTSRGHMRFMIREEGGVNAEVFIEFLRRLMIGSKNSIFLIVDRGPAHIAKKTKAFVASLGGRLRLFYLPPYSPDRNPDELVWKHLKADTVGRASIVSFGDFKYKVRSSMLCLQRSPAKIRAFFQKPSLRYAA